MLHTFVEFQREQFGKLPCHLTHGLCDTKYTWVYSLYTYHCSTQKLHSDDKELKQVFDSEVECTLMDSAVGSDWKRDELRR